MRIAFSCLINVSILFQFQAPIQDGRLHVVFEWSGDLNPTRSAQPANRITWRSHLRQNGRSLAKGNEDECQEQRAAQPHKAGLNKSRLGTNFDSMQSVGTVPKSEAMSTRRKGRPQRLALLRQFELYIARKALVVVANVLTEANRGLESLVLSGVAKPVLAIALALSLGFHWALFQSVAWVTMVVDYSQNGTLFEALAKTFDGKHPCNLCRQIAKGKQSEKKPDTRPGRAKLEFSHARTTFVFTPPNCFWTVRPAEALEHTVTHRPAVPPPRALA